MIARHAVGLVESTSSLDSAGTRNLWSEVATNAGRFLLAVVSYFFRGVLPSETWVIELTDEALDQNPGAQYPVLPGVGGCIFDNLTIQVAPSWARPKPSQESVAWRN